MKINNNNKMWIFFGFISIFFHIFLIFSGLIPNLISRPLHMALIIPWIFLYNKKTIKILSLDFLFTVVGCLSCFWIAINSDILMDQYGFLESDFQVFISITL